MTIAEKLQAIRTFVNGFKNKFGLTSTASMNDLDGQITDLKGDMVDNLTVKGITGLTGNETYPELVPEILNISTGSDINDYFLTTMPSGMSDPIKTAAYLVKKFPRFTFDGTNCEYMFRDFASLTSIDFTDFDTSNAMSMRGMFMNCSSLPSLDLSSFDTSGCMSMSEMFA